MLESWQLQIEESGHGKCHELLLCMEDFSSLFVAAPESGARNNFCCQLLKVSAEFHFHFPTLVGGRKLLARPDQPFGSQDRKSACSETTISGELELKIEQIMDFSPSACPWRKPDWLPSDAAPSPCRPPPPAPLPSNARIAGCASVLAKCPDLFQRTCLTDS